MGKTHLTCGLLNHWHRRGRAAEALKPVISGFQADDPNSDTHLILNAMARQSDAAALDAVSPWRFEAPLSPDAAARREGREIDFAALVSFCREAMTKPGGRRLLIEGVGGAFVPLTGKKTVADWMKALDIPAIVVAGSYLGALSHCLATVEALTAREIRIAGIVLSESAEQPMPLAETAETLARFLDNIPVRELPRRVSPTRQDQLDADLEVLAPIFA